MSERYRSPRSQSSEQPILPQRQPEPNFFQRIFSCCGNQQDELKPEPVRMAQRGNNGIHLATDESFADSRQSVHSPHAQELSKADRVYLEEIKNMTILLEHYKLELSLMLPKICLLIRKAIAKGNMSKLEKTKKTIEKTITKVRKGVISDYGPLYNCKGVIDFETKLRQFSFVNKDISQLNLEIETSIQKAIEGGDPELLIKIEDHNLNMEVYQQIVTKVYSVIRYKIYQRIKIVQKSKPKKLVAQTGQSGETRNTSQDDINASGTGGGAETINDTSANMHDQTMQASVNMSQNELPMNQSINVGNENQMMGEDELKDLVRELDVEQIRQDVFQLYEVKSGIDTQLSLRKVQVLEAGDQMFQNYLECLKEAHDRFLTYIFQAYKFQKMEQNPMHSKDLNHGVPQLFNNILDDMLDDTHEVMAQEYQLQQLHANQNQAQGQTSPQKANPDDQHTDGQQRSGSMHQLMQQKQFQTQDGRVGGTEKLEGYQGTGGDLIQPQRTVDDEADPFGHLSQHSGGNGRRNAPGTTQHKRQGSFGFSNNRRKSTATRVPEVIRNATVAPPMSTRVTTMKFFQKNGFGNMDENEAFDEEEEFEMTENSSLVSGIKNKVGNKNRDDADILASENSHNPLPKEQKKAVVSQTPANSSLNARNFGFDTSQVVEEEEEDDLRFGQNSL